ncbi:MAG: hypothetical protein AMXMBFR56_18440 [Polyangiaceae bacterium]
MTARALPLLLLFALGCQGQTVGEGPGSGGAAGSGSATSGGASSGGSSSGGSSSGGSAGGVSGPGAHGSLPSGYCCTSDSECRYRNCRDFGGVKMCSDSCTTQDTSCNAAPNMKCDTAAGECVPSGSPTCIPAQQWTSGSTPIGGCCVATGDGQAGEECQGNLCMAFGELSNPFICTHACDAPKDCPPKYECNSFTRFCWPIATTYDCQ